MRKWKVLNIWPWKWQGPEWWLRRKNGETEVSRGTATPGIWNASPVHPKSTNFKTARRADLEWLTGKPETQNALTTHVGNRACFWKEVLGRAHRLGKHMGRGVVSEEAGGWCKAARGPDAVLENQRLPACFHHCNKMGLRPRGPQVKPRDLEGHPFRFLGLRLQTQTTVSLLEIWDSSKFHSLKCRPEYSFPILTSLKLDRHSHQEQLKILCRNRKYSIVIRAVMTWAQGGKGVERNENCWAGKLENLSRKHLLRVREID